MRQVLTTMHVRLTLAVLIAGLFTGCQYRWGSLMHPQVKTIAIGDVQNGTREPQLATLLKAKLADKIMIDGSLKLVPVSTADAILTATIRTIDYQALAATKQRDEDARQDDKHEYQSSLYRATITLDITVKVPGKETPLVSDCTVKGVGDYNRLPDPQMARRAAYDLALRDAAVKAVAEITEAW
ncbi:MAG: hypothetical protein HN904_09745 [Victivallales bacterium]|jgi:hypothetical protein|nr:hypothetical protein [Victivallales bacterium]MBT7163050.1 hypothetical protein [Victivallales bacterium]